MSLHNLRDELNGIDDQIVDLLRRRSELAEQVGRTKRENDLPFYQPDRERQILDSLAGKDLGRFPLPAAQAIFREIMAACLSIQVPVRVAYLGPAGTFTEIAALKQFGEAAEYLPQPDFQAVFAAVESRQAKFGLVPVENSTAGTIREVLDLLAAAQLTIVGETYFDVHHCLLSHAPGLDGIEFVYSKDTALEQCRLWLRQHLPTAEYVPIGSTAEGAQRAAGCATAAAIAPERASQVYELPIIARNIEDRSDNRTRFFALGHDKPEPSGADKTSLLMAVRHEPGALVRALNVLRTYDLNMTLIESRPSPNAVFEYVFFIDIEGHVGTPQVQKAIADLSAVCMMVQVLGSYPRAIA